MPQGHVKKLHKLLLKAFQQHSLPVLALLIPFGVQDVIVYYIFNSSGGVSCCLPLWLVTEGQCFEGMLDFPTLF